MKNTVIVLAACTLLSSCSAIKLNLDNRVVCTAAKDKSFVISQYGGVGVSSEIAPADAAIVCPLPTPVVK